MTLRSPTLKKIKNIITIKTKIMGTETKNRMKVRNVKFDFNDINNTHYISDNIFATHFLNSLHVVFPEGEKMFIRSVKNFYKEIKDPDLKKAVKDFMGQEGIHHREHERFWDKLEEMNLKPMGFVKFFRKTGFDILEKQVFNILPKRTAQKLLLSVTVALEHYTALFGNQALGNEEFHQNTLPKEMFLMMQWHAAEELEHKAVAFNVLQQIDDSYPLRISGMMLASALLYFYAFAGMAYFIKQDKDKDLSNLPKKLKDFVVNFTMKPKDAAGWKLLMDYYKPGFHPDDHDNYHLAEKFFEEYKTYFEEKYATA